MLIADLFNKLWEAMQPGVIPVTGARTRDGKKQVVAVRDGYKLADLPERSVSRPNHTVRTVDDLAELLGHRGFRVCAVVNDEGVATVYVDEEAGPEHEFVVFLCAAPGDVLNRWHGKMMPHTVLLEMLTRYGTDFADQVCVKRMVAQLAQLDIKSGSGSSLSVGPNGEILSASATANRSMSVQLPEFIDTVPVPMREDPDCPELPARLRVTAHLTDGKLFVRLEQVDSDAWRRVQVRNYASQLRRKLWRSRAPETVTVVCGVGGLAAAYSDAPLLLPVREPPMPTPPNDDSPAAVSHD